jgi:ribonuclease R
VHVTELGSDYFQYDEVRHELRGERTGIRYQLTERVTVQVSRVDLDARKIDLRLVNEPGIRTLLKNEARRAEEPRRESKTTPAGKKAGKTASAKAAKTAKPVKAKRSKTSTASSRSNRSAKSYGKSPKRKR